MKKKLISLAVASVIGTTLSANYLEKDKIEEFSNLEIIKESGIQIKQIYDADSLFVISIANGRGNEVLYLTKDKRYIIAGNAIDTETKSKLMPPLQGIEMVKGKESFEYGKGDKIYYLFTDPECPYCKEFEKYLPQLENKVKFKIYHLPIESIHPNAKEISKYQIYASQKNKNILEVLAIDGNNEDYKKRKYDKKTEEKLNKKIDEQIQIAKTLGIEGTPSVYTPDGQFVNWIQLLNENGIKMNRPGM